LGELTDPASIVNYSAIPSETARNVFVIGCYSRHVTLYAQQVRALTLVYALFETDRLSAGKRVLVVGAGAAGLTAACAARQAGAEVEILEQRDGTLPLLRGNTTRWIHPRIYEWPMEGWDRDDAGLPLLNWTANYAGRVARWMDEEYRRNFAEIKVTTQVSGVRVTQKDGRLRTKYECPEKGVPEHVGDVVLLAVGFGVEEHTTLPTRSYWRNDSLDQPEMRAGEESVHYLISGGGDGGLVDLMRVRLTDFDHESLVSDLLCDLSADERRVLERRLTEIEATTPREHWLGEFRQAPFGDRISERVSDRCRTDTEATLLVRDEDLGVLSEKASLLNRFFAALVLEQPRCRTMTGTLASVARVGSRYRVRVKKPGRFRRNAKLYVDEVVIRHGPKSAMRSAFPEWHDPYRRKVESAGDHPTTSPIFADFFGPPGLTPKKGTRLRVHPSFELSPTQLAVLKHVLEREGLGRTTIPSSTTASDLRAYRELWAKGWLLVPDGDCCPGAVIMTSASRMAAIFRRP
jgi:hypothetical protein